MTNIDPEMLKLFRAKAEKDGAFAVAFAVLTLANEHRQLQDHLTFSGPGHHPGVLEKIGIEMADLALAAGGMAQGLRDIAERD